MEAIIARQQEIIHSIEQINRNFKKDSKSRKTTDYVEQKLQLLDELFQDFSFNDNQLQTYPDKNHEYFTNNMFTQVKSYYDTTRNMISSYIVTGEPSTARKSELKLDNNCEELLQHQNTNFRAFQRFLQNCNVDEIHDNWEIEDKLRNLQLRWNNIDTMHWQIDGLLEGSDIAYENKYTSYENKYEELKKKLHLKQLSTAHTRQSTPQIDIPVFTGNYTHWPTFLDLFKETIHQNCSLSKSQKMQHLKSKLRGEPERLIQHLSITSENYDTAWNILNQRYNNQQLLFTKQIEIFLNQPNLTKQSSSELKRLHDVSTECINGIENLGVDTSTWGPLLVHLILKKLDPETYKEFQESRIAPRDLSTFSEIKSFLESKFIALEPISRRQDASFNKHVVSNNYMKKEFNKPYNSRLSKMNYNRAFHTSVATQNCPLCNTIKHALFQCTKFEKMPSVEKLNLLTKFKICNNCLYVHERKVCNSTKRCKKCNEAHNTLLHDIFFSAKSASKFNQNMQSVSHVHSDDEILLTTVQVQVLGNDGNYVTLRGLLDQGSQSTLITENAVQRLGLQRQHFSASVCGVGALSSKCKGKVELTCKSGHEDYTFSTTALIIPKLINNLPAHSFAKKSYGYLNNLVLADPFYNISKPVDILFDAQVYSEIIMNGLVRGLPHQIIAQQTRLGWILSGNITKSINCHVILNNHDDISKFWELEDIVEHNSQVTCEEQYCEDFYISTTRRLPSGKYEVRLPMKPNYEKNLGSSKAKAMAQFNNIERKLVKNETLFHEYRNFMQEYLNLGHMVECNRQSDISCYLPHHNVHKIGSLTSRTRVVFNASSKTSSGYSLNDLMEIGPKLQQDILSLLIHWRSFRFVYTADCEKMYRMILLHSDDQQLQKVFWRNSRDDKIREYRLCTLTYGMKASPFLAMRTMKQLACDEVERYPAAAEMLLKNFYVDDLLGGNHSIEKAKQMQTQLIQLLQSGGFNLRKWCSNTPELLNDLQTEQIDPSFIEFKYADSTKTLGLRWDASSDSFKFNNKIDINIHSKKCMTKREMLSQISKIYDPLGWLSPITIKAKLLFQRVWSTGISWDDTIPHDIYYEVMQLMTNIQDIHNISIPRWLGSTELPIELHGFADSSEKAYACCIYLKTKNDKGIVSVTLVAAKTKLAPLKHISLPRLELCATVLLAKLMKKILCALRCSQITMYGWTDSMVTLGWIYGDVTRWKTFIANRVKEVTEIMPVSCWRHTRSEDNAADCATRGLRTEQLREHKIWWEGPQWLQRDILSSNQEIDTPTIEVRKCKKIVVTQIVKTELLTSLLNKYSNLTRATRILSWVSRFIHNTRTRVSAVNCNYLLSYELEKARLTFIKSIQQEFFVNEIEKLKHSGKLSNKSNILSLNPFLDKEGLLRVGGRLQHSQLTYNSKHPLLIPRDSRLTYLLIQEAHKATLHGGPSLTLAYLRDKYWIIGGMRVVKMQLRHCVICRRFNTQQPVQLMANLPEPRVTPSRPFTHTGTDFTGYVDIKSNKGRGIKTTKGYIAVFVCFCTKAVHLELVSDLTTASFLAAFKRLCARRGVPKHMYSDNGTNYVGASRVLQKEFQAGLLTTNKDFMDDINSMGVTWHFNAPLWPSAGGLWEAAVKSTKRHLKRVIGEQKLTYEEFYTLLTQIEACLNSRPLYRLTENIEDGFITPGHFLIGAPLLSSTLTDSEHLISLTTRWQLVEKMHKSFWKKWSSEYLHQLQARQKWQHPTKNLQIDDIVLVNDEHMPPSKWALAKIEQLHPGRDGHVRVVTLKTANGHLQRPITKLTPLLLETPDKSISIQKQRKTNCRVPKNRFTCFLITLLYIFLACLPPALCQVNVTKLPQNNTIYFDKIADLRIVQDEWKLVMFYNMSTYWNSMINLDDYLLHLKKLSGDDITFKPIISQLEHEFMEIKHYNSIMMGQRSERLKRGLVNGVGYLANTLFGVLDDKFAQKYESDIDNIRTTERQLFNMLKNYTSILEAENNIMKRNEHIMNQQFTFINNHLKNLSQDMAEIDRTTKNLMHFYFLLTTAFSANAILSNMRRIQETLIDTVTDIYHGKIDIHLLSPDQLENQLHLISSHIHDELTIPVDNVKDLYQFLKIKAKMTTKYLITEIKIPLLYRDQFQLDKMIPVPCMYGNKSIYNIPSSNYIAFNMKKDIFMPFSDADLQECTKYSDNLKMLCYENHPIYNLKLYTSICDVQLLKAINNKGGYCHSEIKQCRDSWIKLHQPGAWLYSCCEECIVRILCPTRLVTRKLKDNGIIILTDQGCTMKGNDFTINAQYNYKNQIYVQDMIYTNFTAQLQLSPLNDILNTSISDSILSKIEDHDNAYEHISNQIAVLKAQDLQQISNHNTHSIATYSILLTLTITLIAYALHKIRMRWRRGNGAEQEPTAAAACNTGSPSSEHRATPPVLASTVHFPNLPEP